MHAGGFASTFFIIDVTGYYYSGLIGPTGRALGAARAGT